MKGLKPRAYNILFHTHTISGIVISAVLFIIFFAGAISLYKNEIYQWEDVSSRGPVTTNINYERLIQRMDSVKQGVLEAHEIHFKTPTTSKPIYTAYVLIETDSTEANFSTFTYNPLTDHVIDVSDGNSNTTGETLYRLHFLDQIPMLIGRYIAGFVSLFFAFAVVTGLLIHWKNIVSKFYAFSFKDVKKQFWTNAHTVFGLIGLPFQLMYAITGAFYMLSLFVLIPTVVVLFKGDDHKLMEMIYPLEQFHEHSHDQEKKVELSQHVSHFSIASAISKIKNDHEAFQIQTIDVINYGRENAVLSVELHDPKGFNQNGLMVLDLKSNMYKLEVFPDEKSYVQSILQGINVIHFGDFGGGLIKGLYFLLSIFSCFVIISGVLIWKEARNKPSYTEQQRKFHSRVTSIYLSICFSLIPATAILFISEQLFSNYVGRAFYVQSSFFVSWLILTIISFLFKNERKITQFNLIIGGVLGCLVPMSNGFCTGDWFWCTAADLPFVFMTDLVWLLTGIVMLILSRFMNMRTKANA